MSLPELRVLHPDFSRGQSLEELIVQVCRAARQRAGMTEQAFRHAVNLRAKHPIGEAAVVAYELGRVGPGADTFFAMLAVAGLDAEGELKRLLARLSQEG